MKYEVVFVGLTGADGELHKQGEILTAEQIGNVDLHLDRGAIKPVDKIDAPAPIETPTPTKKGK